MQLKTEYYCIKIKTILEPVFIYPELADLHNSVQAESNIFYKHCAQKLMDLLSG